MPEQSTPPITTHPSHPPLQVQALIPLACVSDQIKRNEKNCTEYDNNNNNNNNDNNTLEK